MTELLIMTGAAALTIMSTALYLVDRDNDRLREEVHQLREESRMLHLKDGVPLPEEEN